MKAFISILTTISPTIYLNFHDTNLHIQFYEEKWYVQDVDWIIQKYHAVIWSKSSQTEIKSLSGWKSFQTYVSIPFDRVDMFIFYKLFSYKILTLGMTLYLLYHYTIIVFHVNMQVVPWNMVNAFYKLWKIILKPYFTRSFNKNLS